MEHAIGTHITLEVVEDNSCEECFFVSICNEALLVKCNKKNRTDHKDIIYKEIKEE